MHNLRENCGYQSPDFGQEVNPAQVGRGTSIFNAQKAKPCKKMRVARISHTALDIANTHFSAGKITPPPGIIFNHAMYFINQHSADFEQSFALFATKKNNSMSKRASGRLFWETAQQVCMVHKNAISVKKGDTWMPGGHLTQRNPKR